jgi:hypothetical protein
LSLAFPEMAHQHPANFSFQVAVSVFVDLL